MSMATAAANNIPLSCLVCSGRKDFSDVSHLLTHVASKGHLSNYYKLKVKAGQDAITRQIIDDYDEWYDEYNINDLMQERMNQKEIKTESKNRSNGGASVRRSSTPGLAMASVRKTPAPTRGSQRQSRLRSSTVQRVDPSLHHNTRLSQRPPSRSDTPMNGFSLETDYIRGNSNALPPMQHFSFSRSHSPIKQEEASSEYSDGSYETAPQMTTRGRCAQAHLLSGSNASIYDDNGVDEMVNDSTKLKGVVWPGMDWFDSATADMKRKRNQKKNASVLLQLQATSEDTDPTEMVFRGLYHLEKERVITGNPESDDSLISGESEPEPDVAAKKQTRRRARAPLADKNTNTGRVLRKSERGAARHRPFGRDTHGPYPDLDEDMEEDSTFRPKKARKGLSIHHDNSGPDVTFSAQPPPMACLNSSFNDRSRQNSLRRSAPPLAGYSQSNAMVVDNFTPRAHSRQPSHSWGGLTGSYQSLGSNVAPDELNVPSLSTHNFAPYSNHAVAPQQTRPPYPYGLFNQPFPVNENPLFQPQQSAHEFWDQHMFGFTTPDLGIPDMSYHGENPLFLSGDKSDDEGTISAGNSEH